MNDAFSEFGLPTAAVSRIRPNFGVNVSGTGEETIGKRTNVSPVPGT